MNERTKNITQNATITTDHALRSRPQRTSHTVRAGGRGYLLGRHKPDADYPFQIKYEMLMDSPPACDPLGRGVCERSLAKRPSVNGFALCPELL